MQKTRDRPISENILKAMSGVLIIFVFLTIFSLFSNIGSNGGSGNSNTPGTGGSNSGSGDLDQETNTVCFAIENINNPSEIKHFVIDSLTNTVNIEDLLFNYAEFDYDRINRQSVLYNGRNLYIDAAGTNELRRDMQEIENGVTLYYFGEATSFPDIGGGTEPNPDVGGGTEPDPDVGGGTEPDPDVGGGTDPDPDVGGGTDPDPDVGGGTDPNPDVGGGTDPNPDVGGGTDPNPDVGGGTDPNPDAGGGTDPDPDTGGDDTTNEPITDLTGYTVIIPAGWTASSGYGIFDISGTVNYTAVSGNLYEDYAFSTLNIGYFRTSATLDNVSFKNIGYEYTTSPDCSFVVNITGGNDVDEPSLIQWFVENNAIFTKTATTPTLISFTIDGTTYQAEEGMIWADWIDTDYNTIGLYRGSYDTLRPPTVTLGEVVYKGDSTDYELVTNPIESGASYTMGGML